MNLTFSAVTTINAPEERIWKVIADLRNYSTWNPFIIDVAIKGGEELKLGSKLIMKAKMPTGLQTFHTTVSCCEEYTKFSWAATVIHPLIMSSDHIFTLETLDDGSIKLVNDETFSGIIAPFIVLFGRKTAEKAFAEMNEAIKAEVEKSL